MFFESGCWGQWIETDPLPGKTVILRAIYVILNLR